MNHILSGVNKFIYPISWAVVLLMILSANRVQMPGTPYELLVLELKANEGYRSWWYRDGYVKGRQAYSIGFGWNDQGKRRRNEVYKWTRDGKVTYDEALEITLMEIGKYGRLHKDPYKNVALKLYSYNCGLTTDGRELGGCCGYRKGCGNKSSNIRKCHNRMRKFEIALWNRDINSLIKYHDENKEKVKLILRRSRR